MFTRPNQRVNLEGLQRIAEEAVARYGSDWPKVRQHITEQLQGLSKDEEATLQSLVTLSDVAHPAGPRH